MKDKILMKYARPLCLALAFTSAIGTSHAALVSPWIERLNNANTSNLNTASPTLGTGASNSANGLSIYATIPTITLSEVGDFVTLTGSATFSGNTGGANQFRWGLFDVNGSSDDTGWLGYAIGNGHNTNSGQLNERNNPNNVWYMVASGQTNIQTAAAPGTAFDINNNTYSFILTLERVATGLQINGSLVRASDSQQFALINWLEPTPETYTYNRVGFLSGGQLNASLVQFSNITVIPEPGAAILGGLGLLALLRRRRAA